MFLAWTDSSLVTASTHSIWCGRNYYGNWWRWYNCISEHMDSISKLAKLTNWIFLYILAFTSDPLTRTSPQFCYSLAHNCNKKGWSQRNTLQIIFYYKSHNRRHNRENKKINIHMPAIASMTTNWRNIMRNWWCRNSKPRTPATCAHSYKS